MINAFDKWELAPGNRTRSVRTNEIAQTPLEVSIEGSSTLISHLPSALIINHQSVLNSHPAPALPGGDNRRPRRPSVPLGKAAPSGKIRLEEGLWRASYS